MKLSVLLITYNHEKFIARALESVLMQETDFDFELVIAEDRSSDGTGTIVRDFARHHPSRVRLIERPGNVGAARNLVDGFLSCQGEYVALLEGDDYWTHPAKLQWQVEALEEHPAWALCFHPVTVLPENGHEPSRVFPAVHFRLESGVEDLLAVNFIQTCSVMVRNRLVRSFPEWYYGALPGDWPFSILHARHGKIGFLPEVMAAYRRHGGGAWSRDRLEILEKSAALFRSLQECLDRRQRRVARETLAGFLLEMATLHATRGHTARARSCLWRALLTHPLNRRFLRRERCAGILRVAPGLHAFLRRNGRTRSTPPRKGAILTACETRKEKLMAESEGTSPPGETAPSGSYSKEELKRALKAFRKRLKLTRLDDESKLGHGAMTGGGKSAVVAITPPDQYPRELWDKLVAQGKLRYAGHGLYELASG